jgi:hypothetical protein
MWPTVLVLLTTAFLVGCSDAPSGEKDKRPVGISEEVWKVYSGTESGVTDDKKDAAAEKKK